MKRGYPIEIPHMIKVCSNCNSIVRDNLPYCAKCGSCSVYQCSKCGNTGSYDQLAGSVCSGGQTRCGNSQLQLVQSIFLPLTLKRLYAIKPTLCWIVAIVVSSGIIVAAMLIK